MATILERIQEKYPDAPGINDARNIAEAVACVNLTGGRGANAISDNILKVITNYYQPNGATGSSFTRKHSIKNPTDLSAPEGWTPPEGKGFAGWGNSSDATLPVAEPHYDLTNAIYYAIWKELATVTYSANGGTGTIEPVTVFDGTVITLSDGTGLTAPEDKEFAGWGSTSLSEEADVESPYTVTEDVTLYAVWAGAEEWPELPEP